MGSSALAYHSRVFAATLKLLVVPSLKLLLSLAVVFTSATIILASRQTRSRVLRTLFFGTMLLALQEPSEAFRSMSDSHTNTAVAARSHQITVPVSGAQRVRLAYALPDVTHGPCLSTTNTTMQCDVTSPITMTTSTEMLSHVAQSATLDAHGNVLATSANAHVRHEIRTRVLPDT